jgi:hypothetical protein
MFSRVFPGDALARSSVLSPWSSASSALLASVGGRAVRVTEVCRAMGSTNAAMLALAPGLSSSTLTSFPSSSPAQSLLGVLPPCPARRCGCADLRPQHAVQRIPWVAAVRWGTYRARHLELSSDGLSQQRRGRGDGHKRGRGLSVRVPTDAHRYLAMDAACKKLRPGAHRGVRTVWRGHPAQGD